MATTTLYHDTRKLKADGTAQIKVAVNTHGGTAFIATGICVTPAQWNKDRLAITAHPAKAALNGMLTSLMARVKSALAELSTSETAFVRSANARQLRDRIDEMLNPKETAPTATLGDCFDNFIARHENPRTRSLYEGTKGKIRRYDADALTQPLEHITKMWLEAFFVWMADTAPSVNARNIYLRNLRAVFNDAIDNGVTAHYPFRRFRIKAVATAKRSLTPEQLAAIFFGEHEAWLQRYVDTFLLSFLLIGINMADLLLLPKDAIQDGRIVYHRAKTKRLYSIKVEPEAAELLAKYAGRERLLAFVEDGQPYIQYVNLTNRNLKRIMPGLTTYYARHSWATIASSLDISKDVIAAALGHGGQTVTDVYIDFDRTKVDRANRAVIDAVYKYRSHPEALPDLLPHGCTE